MGITSVRIRDEVSLQLEQTAARLHRSKSSVINQAILEFLERESKEQHQWQETLDALQSLRHGQVVSSETVHDWLSSWGTDEESAAPGS
jgi:predicted transcriptional regulator